MNILNKINFLLKNPKIVVVAGEGKSLSAETIYLVLKSKIKTKKIREGEKTPLLEKDEILVIESKFPNIFNLREYKFLFQKSSLPILVLTNLTDIFSSEVFLPSDEIKIQEIVKLSQIMPSHSCLVLNFDDEIIRKNKDLTKLETFTFGFAAGADLRITDVKIADGVNFKINYKGSIVPVWSNYCLDKKQMYSFLVAFAVGEILGLNFIEIAEILKDYDPSSLGLT